MATAMTATKLAIASHQIYQIMPTAKAVEINARIAPAPVFFGLTVRGLGFVPALFVTTLIAACWGASQWILGQPPTALLVAPGAAALAGLVYGVSFVGQGLGSEQMYMLRSTLTELSEGDEVP